MGSAGVMGAFLARDAGFLDPVLPEFIFPDVKDPKTWGGWDATFYDKERKYIFTYQYYLKMPFYNTALLAPEKVQRLGAKVFLDPSLKGKIIWHDPLIPGSGNTFGVVMRHVLGDAGLTEFVTKQVVFTSSMNDLVAKMARGEYAISLGPILTGLIKPYQTAGVKIDIQPLGNTPELGAYGDSGSEFLVVLKNRPHPNATRVFINWLLSKRIAALQAAAMAQDSRRTDVASVVELAQRVIPGANYIVPQREEMLPQVDSALAFIKKARGK
jgi:ABC-type Fe3+ transport system substrate-binding protein